VGLTRHARSLALEAVKRAAAAADRVRPPGDGAVILIYHRVGGGSGVELDIPRGVFRDQVQQLGTRQLAARLDDVLELVAQPIAPASNPVVVTFDDGTADFVDQALPELLDAQVPALLYLATGFVDGAAELPYGGRPLSWGALRDALSTGLVTIGSHTHSHAVLANLTPTEIDAELHRSCSLIEDNLGVAADHFAYPKGVVGTSAAGRAVRRFFRSAATGRVRTNRYGATDPYQLGRTPIQRSDAPPWFDRKIAGGLALEGTLRAWLNHFRYAGTKT
jgi:peptidoglycan/xylan/chitin deacetylase (PgdA/CDA1 family)